MAWTDVCALSWIENNVLRFGIAVVAVLVLIAAVAFSKRKPVATAADMAVEGPPTRAAKSGRSSAKR